jgi:hypothetical protein
VGADEIQRDARLFGVRRELLDPFRRRSGRAADSQLRVHRLDGPSRLVVEPQVLKPRTGPEDIQVRLVPHLECPVRDLVNAVPGNQVSSELGDQAPPLIPLPRRGDDSPVGEDGLLRVTRQRGRHEGQLNYRTQPQTEQAVVDGVGPGEVEPHDPARAASDDAIVVVEDRVRAHHLGPQVRARLTQRIGKLRGDLTVCRSGVGQQLGQALGPDHLPDAAQPTAI